MTVLEGYAATGWLCHEPIADDPPGLVPCPSSPPTVAGPACTYRVGDMECGCPGYVASYNGDCASCTHPRSAHW